MPCNILKMVRVELNFLIYGTESAEMVALANTAVTQKTAIVRPVTNDGHKLCFKVECIIREL